VSGIVFVALVVIGARLPGSPPKIDDATRQIVAFLATQRTQVAVAGFLGGLSVVALLGWAGSLWGLLRSDTCASGAWPNVAIGGLIVGVMHLMLGFTLQSVAALELKRMSPHDARLLFGLSRYVFDSGAFGFAALVGATAVVAFRTPLFPRWFARASVVLAVGWLTAGYGIVNHGFVVDSLGLAVFVAWLAWVTTLSIHMLRATGLPGTP